MNVQKIKILLSRADGLEGEADELRWEAAKMMAEKLGSGSPVSGGRGKTGGARELARAIGRDHTLVLKYVAVWEQYPHLRGKHPFGQLCLLVSCGPEEAEIVLAEADRRGVGIGTVRDQRSKERLAGKTVAQLPQQRRAEIVAELLTDPDVAEEVMADTTAAAAISRASHRVQDRHEQASSGRQRGERPDLHRTGAFLKAGTFVAHARHDLMDAIEALADVVLKEEETYSLNEDVEAVQVRLDGLRSRLATGNIDEGLRALLSEET